MISIEAVPVAHVLASEALIAEYSAECSIPAIGEINPQHETYAALENMGLLHSFMAFDDGRKIGFAMVVTPILPHYGKRVASTECLFIAKGSRKSGAGTKLKIAIKQYVKQVGCVGILYSAPAGGQFERLLEATRGCQRTNAVFYESLI